MKSDKEEVISSMTDVDDISSKWKPSEGINWDLIQRMRFMNADAEIAPDDNITEEALNKTKKGKGSVTLLTLQI